MSTDYADLNNSLAPARRPRREGSPRPRAKPDDRLPHLLVNAPLATASVYLSPCILRAPAKATADPAARTELLYILRHDLDLCDPFLTLVPRCSANLCLLLGVICFAKRDRLRDRLDTVKLFNPASPRGCYT